MIGRAVEPHHLKRILAALEGHTTTKKRDRALIVLAMMTGARVGEIVSLDIDQVLEDPRTKNVRIRAISALRKDQIKGKREAGILIIPEKARAALRRWIRAGAGAGLLELPASPRKPLFVVIHGCAAKNAHPGDRLSRRTAQNIFHKLQLEIGILPPYRFHDLRHTFQSALAASGAHPYTIAAASRIRNVKTTMVYVHTRTDELRKAVEKAW
jgi:integrase